jgi:hypothetical protein
MPHETPPLGRGGGSGTGPRAQISATNTQRGGGAILVVRAVLLKEPSTVPSSVGGSPRTRHRPAHHSAGRAPGWGGTTAPAAHVSAPESRGRSYVLRGDATARRKRVDIPPREPGLRQAADLGERLLSVPAGYVAAGALLSRPREAKNGWHVRNLQASTGSASRAATARSLPRGVVSKQGARETWHPGRPARSRRRQD